MGKKRENLLPKLLLLAVVVYVVVSFVQLQVELNTKRLALAELQVNINDQLAQNAELQGMLDMGMDDEYIERMAREKLDYAYPDEQVYVDISGS